MRRVTIREKLSLTSVLERLGSRKQLHVAIWLVAAIVCFGTGI